MARDRIVLPGLPRQDARVLIDRISALEDRLAAAERKPGRAGVISRDYSARAGEFLNIEAPSGELITITLPESTARLRGERVTLAFRNSNEVRIVAVRGTVNSESFVTNDRPGTYEAIADGLGGWYVQVGVSDEGSGAGGGGGGGGSFTPTFDTPVDVALANAEGVSSDFARADHVHRDRIASGNDDGFLSRRVFVNASSAKVGTTFMGVTVEAVPASFADIDDFGDGGLFRIGLAPPGGSGTSGRRGTATASAGGNAAGGGGAFREIWVSRAQLVTLLAAGAISTSVGIGGAAVTGPTSSATSYTTNNAGNNGSGPAVFGPWSCYQGAGGKAGAASGAARAGGGGGGLLSAGTGGDTTSTASTGGEPMPGTATNSATGNLTTLYGGGACGVPAGTAAFKGGSSVWGGASGAAGTATGTASGEGGDSEHGAAGGGSGGRANGAGADAGGAGGVTAGRSSRAAGGTADTGSGARTGGDGADGADATDVWRGLGDGGGGGGGASSSNAAATGGNGGDGGFPGGGGGAGGTAQAQSAAQTSTGGTSGVGGDGLIIIEAYP